MGSTPSAELGAKLQQGFWNYITFDDHRAHSMIASLKAEILFVRLVLRLLKVHDVNYAQTPKTNYEIWDILLIQLFNMWTNVIPAGVAHDAKEETLLGQILSQS